MGTGELVLFLISIIAGFIVGFIALYFSNKRIRESNETVGEVQIIYEETNGKPNDKPLVFFVSYVPIENLHNNETVRMIVRVKNI